MLADIVIDWNALGHVFLAALGFAVVTVAAFALGARLLTNAQNAVPGATKGKTRDVQREVVNRILSYVAFAICSSAVLYGVYLIVPAAVWAALLNR